MSWCNIWTQLHQIRQQDVTLKGSTPPNLLFIFNPIMWICASSDADSHPPPTQMPHVTDWMRHINTHLLFNILCTSSCTFIYNILHIVNLCTCQKLCSSFQKHTYCTYISICCGSGRSSTNQSSTNQMIGASMPKLLLMLLHRWWAAGTLYGSKSVCEWDM